ncbi:membrane protein [Philodulcilactobacillus myokoensis]|uniref:Membrane protein n=1 Tax=Philodulcilactobacillus myokoensis TaxID=2929573 RepID=A0A9W6B1T8_9LACO|nr:ABC transporter permease [Philodulcilactobacillus myokoensis]GLB47335.1 membrane protein [Philodulcilactobacillus myokoensis]
MKFSLQQEFYKFNHQKISFYGLIILLILMIYSAFSNKTSTDTIIQNFGAGQWLTIIVITISSTFLSMEYTNNTILTLFYKRPNKFVIYFSKLFVLVIYSAISLVLSVFVTFILKELIVGGQYHWSDLVSALFLNVLGTFIYLMFIITLALLLISVFKNNAVVVGLGLFNSFLGASLSSAIMSDFPGSISLLKWNPFNMIYIMNQLSFPKDFIKISYLSNLQIIIANIFYIVLFGLLGYSMFKKRRV